jgi:hypothetical protein
VQSVAFGTKDDGGRRREIDLVVIVIATLIQAVDPVAGLFQIVDGAVYVGHLYNRQVGERPGGGTGYYIGKAGGAAVRDDYAGGAGGVRGADDGSQIVRIFYAV